MVRRLPQSEDHFRHAVAQSAVVIHLGEAQIFERQVPHAFERRVHVGRAAFDVFEQRTKLIFRHSCPPYQSIR